MVAKGWEAVDGVEKAAVARVRAALAAVLGRVVEARAVPAAAVAAAVLEAAAVAARGVAAATARAAEEEERARDIGREEVRGLALSTQDRSS